MLVRFNHGAEPTSQYSKTVIFIVFLFIGIYAGATRLSGFTPYESKYCEGSRHARSHSDCFACVYYSGKGEVVAGDRPNDRAFTWWLRSPHSRERRGAGTRIFMIVAAIGLTGKLLEVMDDAERYWSTNGTCGRI